MSRAVPFWTSSGLWAILWSDSQPLRPFPRVHTPRTAHPELRIPSYQRQPSFENHPITLGHPAILPLRASLSPFPASRTHNASRHSAWATGPVYLWWIDSRLSSGLESSPVLFFHSALAVGALTHDLSSASAQLPFVPNSLALCQVSSLLSPGVFSV